MKGLWTSLAVAVFCTIATGQQIKLSGRLITDTGEPVPNTKVRVEGESSQTDANGKFNLPLSSKLREGARITIVVEKKNWVINQPLDGEWNLPASDPQTLDIIIAPWGSKALWTDARIEKELKQKSGDYIEQLAAKYGLTQQVTKEAFDKWATTQNNTANALKDQGRSVDGPEAVRLLGEAASAYRRALLVFTRELFPLEWAMTQHNLGFALQEQGARAKGADAIRLLGEAVAAYRQALTIRTREQLPRQWATTQNDLGNALQGLGTRAEGAEALRLLSEAADAYGQALLFFTRELAPLDWSMTQHNLGSALHERGTRTEGPEALRLLSEAVAAYRQALIVRTREQLPALWAVTQNNLGNALQAQGTRAKDPEARRLLGEAVTAYRQALLVFTREQRPQMWAMTKHNLGSALQEQGLLPEAVTAYQEALIIWTREQRPQQWAMAQNNLARAYFNLKEWTSAAPLYQNVLEVYPDFRPAYERARFLEHDVLFNYQRAFKLSQTWLQRNPNDLSASADFAEKLFTTGSFEESERRTSSLLSDVRVEAKLKIPLLAIEIANLIALKRSTEAPSRIKNLIELLEAQPADFRLQWTFAGTKHFINQSQQLAADKDWLLRLFSAMSGENRDAIVKELTAAAGNFSRK
ncbi:MAG TPA: tetratricopeptide repeat protein [Pyrinomonadaceae bacterium]|nr:tetratricopeptide repeat protein [Pyrinomonadaceae bacterium]